MKSRRVRVRRRQPAENQRPFFDKKGAEGDSFFNKTSQIQPKLNIGKSGDPAEKEAESAAQKVTSQQQVQKAEKDDEPVQKAEQKEEDKSVQKAEKQEEEKPVQKAGKQEEEKPVQKAEKPEEEKPVRKAEQKDEESPVQAKLDPDIQPAAEENNDASNNAQPSFETLLAQRRGGGFPLPDDIRTELERKFGTSFRKVRIHNDPEAAAMCDAIHAMAFTHGYDLYFNEGMYDPGSSAGKELLAHELAHVVQQNG